MEPGTASDSQNADTPSEVTPAQNQVVAQLSGSFVADPTDAAIRYDALSGDYNDLPTYPTRPSYKEFHSKLSRSTQCVWFEGAPKDPHKPSSVPIYQTATFVQPSSTEFGAYDYTRSGNPTRTALEKQVAMLEGAHAAFAFGSGMAALVAVTRLLKAGDELIVGDDIYGGMHRLVSRVTGALHGVKISFVDTTDLRKVEAAIGPSTKMLHMETPSNPLMRVTDVRTLAKLLHSKGVLLSIDSTMMSPILQRPLTLGADIVVHSATKFFGGHSDVMGGLVCLKDEDLSKRIAFFQNAEGSGLDPFSCWLFLRGIKTLGLRVRASQDNAKIVAQFLSKHPCVKQLYYPGLEPPADDARPWKAHSEWEIHSKQSDGGGCVMSFSTGNVPLSRRFIDSLRIFKLTVSFGSVNSLCEMPCVLSHASIPAHLRKLPDDLVRLSIGVEDASDLVEDIKQAFELAAHPHVTNVRSVRRKDTEDIDGAELDLSTTMTPNAGGSGEGDSAANREDAAAIARGEVKKLQVVVRYLKDRLADAEARAADNVATQRISGVSGNGGGSGGTSDQDDGALMLSALASGSRSPSSSPVSAAGQPAVSPLVASWVPTATIVASLAAGAALAAAATAVFSVRRGR